MTKMKRYLSALLGFFKRKPQKYIGDFWLEELTKKIDPELASNIVKIVPGTNTNYHGDIQTWAYVVLKDEFVQGLKNHLPRAPLREIEEPLRTVMLEFTEDPGYPMVSFWTETNERDWRKEKEQK